MWEIDDQRPVWAEIDLNALANNIKEVRRVTKEGVLVTAVVKADAYGHGAIQCAKVFLENGADRLAVAALSEAIELRKAGFLVPILVLGYTPKNLYMDALKYNIILTIYEETQAEKLSNIAKILDRTAKIHIKLDTGMHRIGMKADVNTAERIKYISELPNIEIEGMFTHFACADSKDKTETKKQVAKYNGVCEDLKKMNIEIKIKHVSNSAAIIDLPEYNMNMVRAGIMLYGLYPSNEVIKEKVNLQPAMTLKAKITHIKVLNENSGISYSHIYRTDKKEKIATLPLGYADGYTRILNNKDAYVGIHGKSARVVGSICMDQCMINVTEIENVKVEDEVLLFGNGLNGEPHTDEIANKLNTINYEIVCMISRRVPRVYKRDDNVILIRDYLLD